MFILWVPIWVVFLQQRAEPDADRCARGFAWLLTAALEVPTGMIAIAGAGRLRSRWGLSSMRRRCSSSSPIRCLDLPAWLRAVERIDRVCERADSALLYDSLKADGREAEAAKYAGRSSAIQLGSQGIAALADQRSRRSTSGCASSSAESSPRATMLVLTSARPASRRCDGKL